VTDEPAVPPRGEPAAIALGPILSARWRPQDLDRIRAVAPESRLVIVSREGLADGPLDDVEVLLRGWLSREAFERLLARAPRLAWIHSATAGVERVLTPATLERGIVITNARGVFSRPIAEYVLMMILAVSRRLPQLLELQRERTWQPLEGTEMRDLTIGIVGLGSIGRAVGDLAGAFGARVVGTRRHASRGSGGTPGSGGSVGSSTGASAATSPAEATTSPTTHWPAEPILRPSRGISIEMLGGPEALPVLLGQSDFIVLAAPLTPETENLIDDEALALVKPGAWLINVARGALVDERALLRALRNGPLGGAVLDTFRDDLLGSTSPFYDLPNVIVTPHTSWSSGRVLDRSVELFCDNLVRFAAGEPLHNVVDPAIGY